MNWHRLRNNDGRIDHEAEDNRDREIADQQREEMIMSEPIKISDEQCNHPSVYFSIARIVELDELLTIAALDNATLKEKVVELQKNHLNYVWFENVTLENEDLKSALTRHKNVIDTLRTSNLALKKEVAQLLLVMSEDEQYLKSLDECEAQSEQCTRNSDAFGEQFYRGKRHGIINRSIDVLARIAAMSAKKEKGV